MKSMKMAAEISPNKAVNKTDPLGVHSEIGRKLKQYYDDLTSEEVPDRFAELLKQLEEQETTTDSKAGKGG